MEYFSFVISIIMLIWFVKREIAPRISIQWARTFWTKRIIGIEIWVQDGNPSYSSKDYGFHWKSEPKDDYEVYRKMQKEM